MIISLDGPVAVGKSTVGKLLAQRLGYYFLDTGTMYRALAWKALQKKIDITDEIALADMAGTTRMELQPSQTKGAGQFSLVMDGLLMDRQLYSPKVEATVSQVSKVPAVRKVMVGIQRHLAKNGNIVMAGRDIGTVVLPDADVKIFLTASPEERARRRHEELRQRGQSEKGNSILESLKKRDEADSKRAVSPLKPAADAHIIDTEGLTIEKVVEKILALTGTST